MTTGGFSGWSVPRGALHWRTWGDDIIVYNEASGDTHLLRPVDAAVLERLQQGPARIPQLVAHVVEALRIEESDELYFYVDDLLTKLENLALVEKVRK